MRELVYETLARKRKPRGVTAKARAKRKRADASVAQIVRATCELRDGYCRIGSRFWRYSGCNIDDIGSLSDCCGPSEWAHMHSRRRSQTRNQEPTVRHDARHSVKMCKFHHDQYDNRDKPRLYVTALTRAGADGPLKFRRGK